MRDNHNTQPQQTKPLPTSIIRDNHPVKRGRRIHPDRRPLSSELSRYIATHRQRRRTARLGPAPRPAQRRRMTDLILLGRFGAAHAIRHRTDNPFSQVK
jgi:hypothetical protein